MLALRRAYAKKIDPCRMLVWSGRHTVQNIKPGHHRIGSVQAVIWQAGTHWAGPVRIQIYYGPECMDLNTFQARKPTISSTLLIQERFQGYRCESDIQSFHGGLLEITSKHSL